MIKNDQQMKASRAVIADLIDVVVYLSAKDVPESIKKVVESHVDQMIIEVHKEIDDYLREKKFLDHFQPI